MKTTTGTSSNSWMNPTYTVPAYIIGSSTHTIAAPSPLKVKRSKNQLPKAVRKSILAAMEDISYGRIDEAIAKLEKIYDKSEDIDTSGIPTTAHPPFMNPIVNPILGSGISPWDTATTYGPSLGGGASRLANDWANPNERYGG